MHYQASYKTQSLCGQNNHASACCIITCTLVSKGWFLKQGRYCFNFYFVDICKLKTIDSMSSQSLLFRLFDNQLEKNYFCSLKRSSLLLILTFQYKLPLAFSPPSTNEKSYFLRRQTFYANLCEKKFFLFSPKKMQSVTLNMKNFSRVYKTVYKLVSSLKYKTFDAQQIFRKNILKMQ